MNGPTASPRLSACGRPCRSMVLDESGRPGRLRCSSRSDRTRTWARPRFPAPSPSSWPVPAGWGRIEEMRRRTLPKSRRPATMAMACWALSLPAISAQEAPSRAEQAALARDLRSTNAERVMEAAVRLFDIPAEEWDDGFRRAVADVYVRETTRNHAQRVVSGERLLTLRDMVWDIAFTGDPMVIPALLVSPSPPHGARPLRTRRAGISRHAGHGVVVFAGPICRRSRVRREFGYVRHRR